MRAATFFYEMTNEENLILEIIKQGDGLVNKKQWKHATELFKEADNLAEKWRDLYGARIFASLAFCYAHIGNKTMAKHFITQHEEQFGDFGIADENEQRMLHEAKILTQDHSPIMKSSVLTPLGDNKAANTFFIENESDLEFAESLKEAETQTSKGSSQANVQVARRLVEDYNYEEGMNICLGLLTADFDNTEAHQLLLECFHALGFKNELVNNVRSQLKTIMLER